MITRDRVMKKLNEKLPPVDYIHALVESGGLAFGRVDEWSDIDLGITADDDKGAETMTLVEHALEELCPIDLKYVVPGPTWHGQEQVFYRLQNASPFLLIDLCIGKRSHMGEAMSREITGDSIIHFDKTGLARVASFNEKDKAEFLAHLHKHLADSRVKFDLFQILIEKELNRGNLVEAQQFYFGFTLKPLLEVLHMRYYPAHYSFHFRYIYYDFPPEVAQRIEDLYFVKDRADLVNKFEQAKAWYAAAVNWLDKNPIVIP